MPFSPPVPAGSTGGGALLRPVTEDVPEIKTPLLILSSSLVPVLVHGLQQRFDVFVFLLGG
jgi:hypothetical protein